MSGDAVIIPLLPSGLFIPSYDPSTPGYLFKFPFNPSASPLRNPARQEAPHPHQIVEVDVPGSGREIFVPDLGSDVVARLKISGEGKDLRWAQIESIEIKGDEGGGPRHILVSKDGESPSHLVESAFTFSFSLVEVAISLAIARPDLPSLLSLSLTSLLSQAPLHNQRAPPNCHPHPHLPSQTHLQDLHRPSSSLLPPQQRNCRLLS